MWTSSNMCFLGSHESKPSGIALDLAIFAGVMIMTNHTIIIIILCLSLSLMVCIVLHSSNLLWKL